MKRLVALLSVLCVAAGPLPAAPTKFTALGDSLTTFPSDTTDWTARLLTALGGGWSKVFGGVGGERCDQVRGRWLKATATWNPTRPLADSRSGYVIILCGTNDFQQLRAASLVLADVQKIVLDAKVLGAKPIVSTVTPRKGSTYYSDAGELIRLEFNAALRAWAAAEGVALVEAANDFDDGAAALKAAYDYGDHVHWSEAGASRFAALVRAAAGL